MPLYRPQKTPHFWIKGVSEEEEGEEVHQNSICRECAGSGIGYSGDPDRSRCYACNGSGMEEVE